MRQGYLQRKHEQTAGLRRALRKQWATRSLTRRSTLSKSQTPMGRYHDRRQRWLRKRLPQRQDSACAHIEEECTLNMCDHREFPSLSGAPQAQQNTTAQQMWANPTLRTTPHTTIARPQGQTPQQGQPGQAPNQQLQNQGNEDAPQGQFAGAGDDYRFGGQGGVGQLSGGVQPQTGNIEEFPPLGNNAAGEIGPDRRAGLIQNAAAFGTAPGTSAFPGLGQTRNGLPSPTESLGNRSSNATVGGGLAGAASRTQFDQQEVCTHPLSVINANNRQSGQRTGQALGNLSFLGSGIRSGGDATPVGQRSQQSQFESGFGGEGVGSPNAQTSLHKKLAEMTDQERYGLPGLLSMIPLESPDYSSLAMGQDLTVLGLDLSRPE